MIVKMSKVYIAVRKADRDELLNRLGRMNLLHFQPVKPDEAIPDEETLQAITDIDRAIHILLPIEPASKTSSPKPLDAAREAIELQASIFNNLDRRNDLGQRIKKLKPWGNVSLSQFEALRESGIEVRFYMVSQAQADRVRAECAEIISSLPGKQVLMAVVDRSGQLKMPEGSEPVPLPSQDRDSVLAEEKKIDTDLEQGYERLSQLAPLIGELQAERDRLLLKTAYIKAQRSGLSRDELFALQGWLPSDRSERLKSLLSVDGFHAAVTTERVTEKDVPPTLIRYPTWARPIKGLFDMLGTLPGYREMDLSPFFMLALPIFTAMLIGDGGYGLLISLVGLLFYKTLVRIAGRPKTQILVIFGLCTLLWGILTANYFGLTPETLARGGGLVKSAESGAKVDYEALWAGKGFYSQVAKMMRWAAPLWREDPKAVRFLMIKVALIIGCLHLILARLRKMVEFIPEQRALAEFGWIIALADMMVIIWHLLFIGVEKVPIVLWWVLLAAVLLSSWFGQPAGGVVKRILRGFASSMLPLLSTFSDTMSYLRLFAVGLASYFIASAFNNLSAQVAETATWFAAVPILIFGHGLNIGLATIAIFAHGVRLNMLEFSNHVGVKWSGYAYRPFSTGQVTISGKDIS